MRVAILGRGDVGRALAAGLNEHHPVTVASRSPLAGETSYADAVKDADVVILAVAGAVAIAVLDGIGAHALGNRVVIDVTNAFNSDFSLMYPQDSQAERIQSAFPRIRLVKSLNTANWTVLANPQLLERSGNMFLSGNDETAKQVVADLLATLGWPRGNIIDLGDVKTARGPEHWLVFLGILGRDLGTFDLHIEVSVAPPERQAGRQ